MLRISAIIEPAGVMEVCEQTDYERLDFGRNQFLSVLVHPIPMVNSMDSTCVNMSQDKFSCSSDNIIHNENS